MTAGKRHFYGFILLMVILLCGYAMAQADVITLPGSDEETGMGCAVCGLSMFLLISVVFAFIVSIVLMAWTYNDAGSRGENPVLWTVIVFLFSILGLIVYLSARPRGNLISCSNCGKKMLESMSECPHCDNSEE